MLFRSTPIIRLIGLIELPFAIQIDLFNAAYHYTLASIAAVKGAFTARREKERALLEIIIQSSYLRLKTTLRILIELGIETLESLYKEFERGNLARYLAIATLLTVYASRREPGDLICLAIGKRLTKENCPRIGWTVLGHILKLKELVVIRGTSSQCTLSGASKFLEDLPQVVEDLKNPSSSVDGNNGMTPMLRALSTKLRAIEDEIIKLPIDESKISHYNEIIIDLAQHEGKTGPIWLMLKHSRMSVPIC